MGIISSCHRCHSSFVCLKGLDQIHHREQKAKCHKPCPQSFSVSLTSPALSFGLSCPWQSSWGSVPVYKCSYSGQRMLEYYITITYSAALLMLMQGLCTLAAKAKLCSDPFSTADVQSGHSRYKYGCYKYSAVQVSHVSHSEAACRA